ncbi:MAG: DNA-binding protein [Planctomycetes bacterium]|nr:DNA-binding protein [Planctomycetota bacterium]
MQSYHAIGRPGRRLVFRLGSGTDLMNGIRERCEQAGIRAGIVPVVIGGVGRAVVEVAQPSGKSPVGVVAKAIHLDGPLAILGAQGMVCETADGKLEPHLHITFTDSNGHIHGGHLKAGTAPVTTTADVVVEEVLGVKFGRRLDQEVGTVLFFPEKMQKPKKRK